MFVLKNQISVFFFESVSKQLGPIQLSYAVSFDITEFEKSHSDSKILLTFQYDEIQDSIPILINVKID